MSILYHSCTIFMISLAPILGSDFKIVSVQWVQSAAQVAQHFLFVLCHVFLHCYVFRGYARVKARQRLH